MPHRKIRDVVAGRKAHATPSQTTVADAARLMKKHVVGALLIVDDNHLVGIFTERDVVFRVIAADKDPKTTRVAAAMTNIVFRFGNVTKRKDCQAVAPSSCAAS